MIFVSRIFIWEKIRPGGTFSIDQHESNITLSIGIGLYPIDGKNAKNGIAL